MRIAIFTDYYLPTLGGVQTLVKSHKESLEAAGHEVTLFCPLHAESEDQTIVRLPTSRHFKPDGFPFTWPPSTAIAFAKEALIERNIEIVHAHSEMVASIAGLIAAKDLGVPAVQTMHGRLDVYSPSVLPLAPVTTLILSTLHNHHIPHARKKSIHKAEYTKTVIARRMWRLMLGQANYADHVIVPSHHFGSKFKEQGLITPLSILSNGLEDSVLNSLQTVTARRLKKNAQFKVMWCARVSPEKRPLVFLDALRALPDTIHVDMYGDGVALKKVTDYVNEHKLQNRVTIHGAVSQQEVIRAMQAHHVFVSTSYGFDNQPMVLLEAIATGLPILYCDPDLGEFLPRKGSMVTASPKASSIAEAIITLSQSPKQITRMSRACLEYRDKIAQSQYTTELVRLYRALIRSKSRKGLKSSILKNTKAKS